MDTGVQHIAARLQPRQSLPQDGRDRQSHFARHRGHSGQCKLTVAPVHSLFRWTNSFLIAQVFGALTSCELRVSESFYGTGESFLFVMNPKLQIYQWTGENSYFIQGNNESLAIGAGE